MRPCASSRRRGERSGSLDRTEGVATSRLLLPAGSAPTLHSTANRGAGALRSRLFPEGTMPEPLTNQEQQVYHYLLDFLAENTYQPSIRDIAKQFGIKSTKTVSD